MLAGFKEAGLVEGRDYVTTVRNAQGDMATVSALIDAALAERADLLVTFSTPTLQAALQRARSVPIVFTYVVEPRSPRAPARATPITCPTSPASTCCRPTTRCSRLIRRVLPAVKCSARCSCRRK